MRNDTTTKNFTIKANMLLRALTQNIKEAGAGLCKKDEKTDKFWKPV